MTTSISTIQDTQIAIKQYQASLTLEGFSEENGQPAILKSFINQLTDYYDEILNLPPTTLLVDLSTSYRAIVYNIQPYLTEVQLPVQTKELSIKPVDLLGLYKFQYLSYGEYLYHFDLKKVAEPVKQKLALSQRVNLYSVNNEYIATGIIYKLTNSYFSVKTKYLISYEDTKLKYGIVDNFWGNKEYVSTWESEECFEESQMPCWIHVKLYQVKYLYNCAWSLYYSTGLNQELVLVAKGTDNIQPGYAYLSKEKSVFKPGVYTLKSRIIKYGTYSTNVKQIQWELTSSNNFIKNE